MHKNKKIAIFHSEFIYSGGAEKMIFNQVDQLEKLGFKVDVFTCYLNRNNSFPDKINKYKIKQILSESLNKIFSNKIMILLTLLSYPFWVNKIKEFDIYFGENQVGPWLAYLVARYNNKKYFTYQPYPTTFVRPRSIDKVNIFYRLFRKLDVYIIQHAKISFANGIYSKEVLSETYKREFINCPAGAYSFKFTKNIFQKRIKNKYVLAVNRNVPKKQTHLIIEIIPKKAKIISVGQGTKIGYVSESKLIKLYKNASVFIYTAPEEDFGMGIVEAMSFGIPVVAWNNAGPSKIIINKKTGYLIDLNNNKEFSNKVLSLIENNNLNYKMSVNAKKESKKYDWDLHARTLQKYFLLQ